MALEKIVIRFLISSGAINFKTGGGTYADHRSDSEDQAVERQNQVQGGDTVRTLGQGDEKKYLPAHRQIIRAFPGYSGRHIWQKRPPAESFLADAVEVIDILLLIKIL